VTAAVVLATVPGEDGGSAAGLPWGDGTVLRRLLSQLADLGVRSAHVLTRPGWEQALQPSLEDLDVSTELHVSVGTAEDLRAIATIARAGHGDVLVAPGDVVSHREALAGLLADPRVATGALCTNRRLGRAFAFRTRAVRGRVVSTSSPYHAVSHPNLRFLGVVKVAAASRAALADVAERLAALAEPPLPAAWQDELRTKHSSWRALLARLAAGEEVAPGSEETATNGSDQSGITDRDAAAVSPTLSADDDAELQRWVAAAPEDASSLVLVGLVRSGVHVGVNQLRNLFWARPLSREAAEHAVEEITFYDEDRVLLDSAVKANDGFFTTYFVSPYSKYIARWAARHGLTPNQVTTISLGIGVLAAAAFATGERAGLIAGAILLQLAFTTDCVDGQLARYTRTFSSLGAWLDSIFDRTKEYVAFAGLAIGASRTGDPVWLLAGAALALQTVRHAIDFSYPIAQHQMLASAVQPPLEQPGDRGATAASAAAPAVDVPAKQAEAVPDRGLAAQALRKGFAVWRVLHRRSGVRWVKKIVAFPIGERFAVISITAAVSSARTTFIVLLAWGGASAVYKMAGRVLRSVMR
jgi:CDP-alcohol phosphatidyltransferase-like enzyme